MPYLHGTVYISSTLGVWLVSILNVPLKAALSDIMKILVIVNVNLSQGFWLYLKLILCKNQSKIRPNELVN